MTEFEFRNIKLTGWRAALATVAVLWCLVWGTHGAVLTAIKVADLLF